MQHLNKWIDREIDIYGEIDMLSTYRQYTQYYEFSCVHSIYYEVNVYTVQYVYSVDTHALYISV